WAAGEILRPGGRLQGRLRQDDVVDDAAVLQVLLMVVLTLDEAGDRSVDGVIETHAVGRLLRARLIGWKAAAEHHGFHAVFGQSTEVGALGDGTRDSVDPFSREGRIVGIPGAVPIDVDKS